MKLGGRVVWLDVEDRPATVADRSRPLGLIEHVTRPEHFRFFNSADVVEVEALTAGALAWLMDAQDPRFSLVIIDSAERFGCPSLTAGTSNPGSRSLSSPGGAPMLRFCCWITSQKGPKDQTPGGNRFAAESGPQSMAQRCAASANAGPKPRAGLSLSFAKKTASGDMPAGLGRAVATIHGTWDNQGAFSWKVTAPATESGIDAGKG